MKRSISLILASIIAVSVCFNTFAATPAAELADNRLEFSEIDELIAKYNPTILKNDIELRRTEKKIGSSSNDFSENYRSLGDEAISRIVSVDPTDPMYAQIVASNLACEMQADSYYQSADDNLEDIETYRLSFEKSKATLALSAKSNMINYYSSLLAKEAAELELEKSKKNLEIENTKFRIGMSSKPDVLTATEDVASKQKTLLLADADCNRYFNDLIVMCGWKYGAAAELGQLPLITDYINQIAAIDTSEDITKAFANSYDIRINEIKKNNYGSSMQIEALDRDIANQKTTVTTNINQGYANIIAARNAYDYSIKATEVANANLNAAITKHNSGSISDVDFRNTQIAFREAQINQEQAAFSLMNAVESYKASVAGL